jgi:hypothetical protein
MKKTLTLLTAFAFWLAIFPAVFAEGAETAYKIYLNARFGYSVEYPDIFDTQREPDNGDGIEFTGADGEYTLTIWGGYNVLAWDGKSLLDACTERIAHIVEGSKKIGAGFYSIAYSDDGGRDGVEHIFHEYGIVNKDMQAAFVLKYPKKEEKRFVEIKKRLEASFKAPQKR